MNGLMATKKLAGLGLCLAIATSARAVEFNLVDPALEDLDDSAQLMLNVGGVDAMLSTNIGTLNVAGQEFGIASLVDSEGEGRIINGSEELSITFQEDVRWDAFYVWDQDENGCSVIALESVGGDLFCGAGLKMGHSGVVIPAGEAIRLFASDSQGFSLATFAVTPTGEGGASNEGTQDEAEPGSGDPIVRIERSGSGGGRVWFEYFDNANEQTVYLGDFDTQEGTTSVESQVPLNEGIYVYTSDDGCSIASGLYFANGSPVSLNEDGRYGPIQISEDTTLSARFVPNYLLCGSCSVATIGMTLLGLGFMQHRRRRIR